MDEDGFDMNSSDFQHAFHQDGSLRDIYIRNVNVDHWERFLSFVRSSGYSLRYSRDGETAQLPTSAAKILADKSCAHNLTIDLHGLGVCCRFFAEHEIELDVDPREVTSSVIGGRVLELMGRLGTYLARDVVLTEENSPERVWFRYSMASGVIRYERTDAAADSKPTP